MKLLPPDLIILRL